MIQGHLSQLTTNGNSVIIDKLWTGKVMISAVPLNQQIVYELHVVVRLTGRGCIDYVGIVLSKLWAN
jgi:hypothetical protein